MRRKLFLLVVVLTVVFLLGGEAISQTSKPVHLRFAAAGLGSAWYVYAAAIAEQLRPKLPEGSTIDILPTPGGIANTILVGEGRAELGLSFNTTAKWARDGIVAFKEKMGDIRGIYGEMDIFYVGSVVTKKSELMSFEQIKEKKFPLRLMTVPVGGNGEIAARHILEAYGMTYADLKSWGGSVTHTSRTAIASAIKDGHADAWIHTVTPGHPAMSEICLTTEMRFLPIKEDFIKALGQKYGYSRDIIKANTFKGQDYDVVTLGCPTVLIAAKALPDDVAYWTAKVIAENKEKLVKAHAGLKVFNPAEACKEEKLGVALHPGAIKYFKEKGWMK
jgi:TRAP transporter TAXI family solute receptor